MNRRELFKGACTALAAAAIPIPASMIEAEMYGRSPLMDALPNLIQIQQDLVNRITNPPVCINPLGVIKPMSTKTQEEALFFVNKLIEDLDA